MGIGLRKKQQNQVTNAKVVNKHTISRLNSFSNKIENRNRNIYEIILIPFVYLGGTNSQQAKANYVYVRQCQKQID